MLMVIPADIASLIDFFSFAAWLFYGMAVFCVILLRFTRKKADRKIKVNMLLYAVFIIANIYLGTHLGEICFYDV